MADTINSKPRTAKRKVNDIIRPAKGSDSSSPKLVIQRRPIIDRDAETTVPATPSDLAEPTTAPTLEPLKAAPKRTAIVPVDESEKTPDTAAGTPEQAQESPDVQPDTPAAAEPPANDDALDASTDEADNNETETETVAAPTLSNAAATRKAIEEAEAAAKREQQLDEYIEKKTYFVPINAAARRRSIKVSILMTFVALLLGVALINLMLDAGLIELMDDIPHTNFFSDF